MKKKLSLLLVLVLLVGILAGCGNKEPEATPKPVDSSAPEVNTPEPDDTDEPEAPGSGIKLTFMCNVVAEQSATLETILKEFTEETGIEVEYSSPGASYEELMKTKMSANELPDLFTTHGWSVMRYSEYLEPINSEPFASKISNQIKPVITDGDGQMYVLPVDADVAGIVYNIDVLEEAGVDVDEIKTWDDFTDACAKVKAIGIDPLHVGGKDDWTIGQLGDWIAPSFFVTNDADNQRDALKAGEFDAATWERVAGLIDGWVKAGYFNTDALTADYDAAQAAMAEGKTAFGFYGNFFIVDARSVNPDAKLGMMPVPSASADDEPSLIAGERLAIGVWKDSENKEAALQLLNFLAQPENCSRLATAGGNPAGLDGVTSDIGDIQDYVDKCKDVRSFPYFDREYLPSGMWDVMCATGAEILAQNANAVENAGKVMEQNFNDKY